MTRNHSHETGHKSVPENHGEDWDGLYDGQQVWSGNPNDALVAVMSDQLAGRRPGRAVDVGCGEGADAVWLAAAGWRVTAVDVSKAALERGKTAARERGEDVAARIDWIRADVGEAGFAPGSFDLVSAFYPALRKDSPVDACALLISLVAPGGTLLFVHHAEVDRERALAHGFDPDDYVTAKDIAGALAGVPGEWAVSRFETERNVTEGRGAHHHHDIVFLAQRH